jgi:hypothetical protein
MLYIEVISLSRQLTHVFVAGATVMAILKKGKAGNCKADVCDVPATSLRTMRVGQFLMLPDGRKVERTSTFWYKVDGRGYQGKDSMLWVAEGEGATRRNPPPLAASASA